MSATVLFVEEDLRLSQLTSSGSLNRWVYARFYRCFSTPPFCRSLLSRWPSVLRHCWLGGRKGIRPVKKTGGVICLERSADLHMAQMMPLPLTVSCFSKIQIGFYRAMLCISGTSHGPVSVSVCLSQAGVLLKRQNVGSHKQHHTIPQRL